MLVNAAFVQKYAEQIKEDVLADELKAGNGSQGAYQKEWDINGQKLCLGVKKN